MGEEIGQIAVPVFLATDSPENERSGARSEVTSLKGVHKIGSSPVGKKTTGSGADVGVAK